MRVLLLTGTTGFPLLEESLVEVARIASSSTFVIQSPNDVKGFGNVEHHHFLDMGTINADEFDVVVGHCGAGTAFWVLEQQRPYIAVVNLTRFDQHQRDLGNWLAASNLAMVLMNRGPKLEELEQASKTDYRSYEPDPFRVGHLLKMLKGTRFGVR
jgi:UDP-N-acetylglucosamine transferase subunit ALG13